MPKPIIDAGQVIRMYGKLKSTNSVATLLHINPRKVREILREQGVELITEPRKKIWN